MAIFITKTLAVKTVKSADTDNQRFMQLPADNDTFLTTLCIPTVKRCYSGKVCALKVLINV